VLRVPNDRTELVLNSGNAARHLVGLLDTQPDIGKRAAFGCIQMLVANGATDVGKRAGGALRWAFLKEGLLEALVAQAEGGSEEVRESALTTVLCLVRHSAEVGFESLPDATKGAALVRPRTERL